MSQMILHSCTTQPSSNALQPRKVAREELEESAVELNAQIESTEKSVSAHYWNLGQTLCSLRSFSRYGEWKQQLTKLGIDKTRASRSIAIFHTFGSVEELGELTVAQAYAARQRDPSVKSRRTTKTAIVVEAVREPGSFRDFLNEADSRIDVFRTECANASRDEAADLQLSIERLVCSLWELENDLKHKMAAPGLIAQAPSSNSVESPES